MPAGNSRKMGGGKRHMTTKRLLKRDFNARHIDQVFDDFLKPAGTVHTSSHGPIGTTAGVELDEDVPGHGKHFCLPCSKYFVDDKALQTHLRGKPHKRRTALLGRHVSEGSKPHTALDAVLAAGMGAPDNGPRLRSRQTAVTAME